MSPKKDLFAVLPIELRIPIYENLIRCGAVEITRVSRYTHEETKNLLHKFGVLRLYRDKTTPLQALPSSLIAGPPIQNFDFTLNLMPLHSWHWAPSLEEILDVVVSSGILSLVGPCNGHKSAAQGTCAVKLVSGNAFHHREVIYADAIVPKSPQSFAMVASNLYCFKRFTIRVDRGKNGRRLPWDPEYEKRGVDPMREHLEPVLGPSEWEGEGPDTHLVFQPARFHENLPIEKE